MSKRLEEVRNFPVREGASQDKRKPWELATDYVKVDERTIADFLVFTKSYAAHLLFINDENKADGTWENFLENDISYQLALTAVEKAEGYADLWQELLAANNDPANFKFRFDFLFTLVSRIEFAYRQSYLLDGFQEKLGGIIQSFTLPAAWHLLNKYYEAAEAQSLITLPGSVFQKAPITLGLAQDIKSQTLSSVWEVDSAIITDGSFIFGDATTDDDKINRATEYLEQLADQLLSAFRLVIEEAKSYLDISLTEHPLHLPHISLFLGFLRLIEIHQIELNRFTQRHLDFYFREVLALKEREAQPDHVHVVFELAKQMESHKLPEGTQLKAGKDSEGNDVFYKLEEEIVVNKASIDAIKSLYLNKSDKNRNYGFFAAPKADTADGIEEPPESSDSSWNAFHDVETLYPDVGFAFGSPLLDLPEGERKITLSIHLQNAEGLEDFQNMLENTMLVSLSGEEDEWFELDDQTHQIKVEIKDQNLSGFGQVKTLEITFTLSHDDSPVHAVHSDSVYAGLPIARILFRLDRNQKLFVSDGLSKVEFVHFLELVGNARVSFVELLVDVRGVEVINVETKLGSVDPSSSFLPFGSVPAKSASFQIGATNLADKPLSSLKAHIKWEGLPAENIYNLPWPNTTEWSQAIEDFVFLIFILYLLYDKNLFYQDAILSFNQTNDPTKDGSPVKAALFPFWSYFPAWYKTKNQDFIKRAETGEFGPITSWPTDAQNVYHFLAGIKDQDETAEAVLELNISLPDISKIPEKCYKVKYNGPGFGHKDYAKKFALATVDPDNNTFPPEPYTPSIESIRLDFNAYSSLDILSGTGSESGKSRQAFFHVHPFGKEEIPSADSSLEVTLLPTYSNEGELLIGVKSLSPPQNLSLLIQVSEGTANPLAEATEVKWSYLSENSWKEFESMDVRDNTNGLIQSGLVFFQIPKDANSDNSILPDGLLWIRASIEKQTDAICHLIAIKAQAGTAAFSDQGNADDFLNTPLSPKTISKIFPAVSQVKSTEQPYASFGGRPKESADSFYTRISERLRHKNRAVTIWDYERMVLESFPSVYKVKCINHAKAIINTTDQLVSDLQVRPGNTVVILIPELKNKETGTALKPYASLSTLEAVEDFLTIYKCPQASLQVINPKFEEIQLTIEVCFRPGFDESFYAVQLNTDLIEFLSPWAYDSDYPLEFGGTVYKSVILNFVEEREYVDYITLFKLNHIGIDTDTDEAIASTMGSILVSHANHIINQEETAKIEVLQTGNK